MFKFRPAVLTYSADTMFLRSAVGEYATIACKHRHSEDWYLCFVIDGHARSLSLQLAFLDQEKRYIAEIYRDGDERGTDCAVQDRHRCRCRQTRIQTRTGRRPRFSIYTGTLNS